MGSHMQQSGGVPMQQQQQQMHYPPAQGQMLMENGYGMVPSAQPHQTQVQMQMPPQMHFQQMQKQQLTLFWQSQMQEIEQVTDFKTHQLPLARIKKIMKADEDVKMIAAEAPVVFAKACEMFILDLTLRSWGHTEENKRRTLQRNDIAGAVFHGDIFDFLVDIVPRDEPKDEEGSVQWSGVGENGMAVAGDPSVPYGGVYYTSMGQPVMGQQPMGQPVMGQQPMGQQPMGQQPMGQQQMGQQPMGQQPMGQQPMGQVPMGPFMGSSI